MEFPASRLGDWLIVDDGRAKGLFTVQVLRARMSEDERAAHDANDPFGFPAVDQ